MCYMNGRRVTDIGGIAEVCYNGSVLFSNRLFRRIVLVGDFGLAWSSDDGATFNTVQINGAARSLKAAELVDGVLYVAGDGGFLARTGDLNAFASWQDLSYDSSMNYIDVCAGGGSVVALAGGNKCSASLSGGSFATVDMPGSNLGPMSYGNGVFVSPSGTWGGFGAYSSDGGRSWSATRICATKRMQFSGSAPEAYPCRNVAFGSGMFLASSGIWDGSSNHYQYSHSVNGADWTTVEMTPGAAASFCYRAATLYFGGYFYALDFRDAHYIDPARVSEGTAGRNLLWKMDNEKHAACACGGFALVASSGRYGAVENKLAVFRGAINDGACEFVRDVSLAGTIREVVAI